MRGDRSGRLTILSEAEKLALYGLPHFDDFQRIEFFAMTDAERSLAFRRNGLLAQVYCLLQTGYFKAKQAFFRFSLNDVPAEDIAFLLQRYCTSQAPPPCSRCPPKNTMLNAKRSLPCSAIAFGPAKTCRRCSIRRRGWPE